MTSKRAVAAAFWSYSLSNFKALYGRGGAGFTKDFLQAKESVRNGINDSVGFTGDPVILRIEWPGGGLDSRWDNKDGSDDGDDRGQLKVRSGSGAARTTVEPWRVGDPAAGLTPITGNPAAPDDIAAVAVYDGIVASNTRPWIVGVFLEGDRRTLHARSYLTNPPPGLEAYGVDSLPEPLRSAIRDASAAELERSDQKMRGSGFVTFRTAVRAEKIVRDIDEALRIEPNVLVVGPPGCGKTVALEDLEARYRDAIYFDPSKIQDAWSTGEAAKSMHIVFYPAYSYDSFVAGLAPKAGIGIDIEPRPGPLMNMAHWCADDDRDGLLLIDEFNRGPTAAIFGDTLGLLDGTKRSEVGNPGRPISRPHSDRDMLVPEEFQHRDGERKVPRVVALPASLKIVGAYNSTDRSITPLDMALTRRFRTVRARPDPEVLARHLGIAGDMSAPARVYADPDVDDYEAKDVRRLAVELLIRLNERIDVALGEDFAIGHALFWSVDGEDTSSVAHSLAATFQDQVYSSMERAFVGKPQILAAVLNAPEPHEPEATAIGKWVAPTGRLQPFVEPRFLMDDLKTLSAGDQLRRLRSVVLE